MPPSRPFNAPRDPDFLGDAVPAEVPHFERSCAHFQSLLPQSRRSCQPAMQFLGYPDIVGHGRASSSFTAMSMDDFDPNKLTVDEQVAADKAKEAAAKEPQMVTFSPGDWFLGPGDGSVGRGKEQHPSAGTLRGSMDNANEKGSPQPPGALEAQKAHVELMNAKALGANLKGLPKEGMGYNGELQLMDIQRSSTLRFSDLTDSSRFTCLLGPAGSLVPGGKPSPEKVAAGSHPQFEFQEPHHKVHVHLVDKSAGPFGHVLWDGVYDMGGTEVLKAHTEAEGGDKPDMELICPPYHGPPHWYELTVSAEGAPGVKPRMLENFIGSQVIESYRPDQDPELSAFDIDLDLKHAYSSCSVM